jgi:hypothetical protein
MPMIPSVKALASIIKKPTFTEKMKSALKSMHNSV